MDKKTITNSNLETIKLGEEFAKRLKSLDIVLLYGELGSGKTTFVQGLAKGLKISDRILSPTFVLHRSHRIPKRGIKTLNHIDLYRIETHTEIESLGLEEIVRQDSSIAVIEWADRLPDFKQGQGYKIWFKYLGKDKREIVIVPMVVSIRDPARMKFVGNF
mgnify:FL=1